MPSFSVYNPLSSGSSRATTPTINDSLLGSTVSNILGLKETSATDLANAKAEDASVKGYNAETTAYGEVGTIAENNAALAKASGDITTYQDQLKALTTIGEQKAAVASNGFRESGSNLDILRSSLQQSYLKQQLDETQTNINVGGYLAEKAAAKAEADAATAAADSATALAANYRSASTLATTNAANETSALNTYLGKTTLTPAEKLLLAPLSSDPTVATSLNTTSLNTSSGGGTNTTSSGVASIERGAGFGPNGERLTSLGLVGFAGGIP